MNSSLTIESVKQLRELCNRIGDPYTKIKQDLLKLFSLQALTTVNVIKEYHDCLLFLLAYPENAILLQMANRELDRIAETAKKMIEGKNDTKRRQLYGTGIEHTTILSSFTFPIIKWLQENYSDKIGLYSVDGDYKTGIETFKILLPPAEHDTLTKKNLSLKEWIDTLKGKNKSALGWLIRLIDDCDCKEEIKEQLFSNLKIFVSIDLSCPLPSRTFGRSIKQEIFFHKTDLIRKVDALKVFSGPVGEPINISAKEKQGIVATQRLILLSLFRETDPVTSANTEETLLFDMGRGIRIALTCMIPSKRYPFESYIGYMAFKNEMPVSYGGGWIFGNRSRIGVNVFAPYRGGESALLFCQILRLYHQYFGVNSFTVDPYQIGKNNPEGLKSGAFWFYYRLGFRPQQSKYKTLAESEYEKISDNRSYHSPLNVMKQLANAVMQINIEEMVLDADPAEISLSVTEFIANTFEGDRKKAEHHCTKKMISLLGIKDFKKHFESEKDLFTQQSLMYAQLDEIKNWNVADKKLLAKIMLAKGGENEVKYIQALLKHRNLHESLSSFLVKDI